MLTTHLTTANWMNFTRMMLEASESITQSASVGLYSLLFLKLTKPVFALFANFMLSLMFIATQIYNFSKYLQIFK